MKHAFEDLGREYEIDIAIGDYIAQLFDNNEPDEAIKVLLEYGGNELLISAKMLFPEHAKYIDIYLLLK